MVKVWRLAPLALLFLVTPLLVGCPYDASIEPSGVPPPLRSSVVGAWFCNADDEPWAELTIGQTSGGLYYLVLRPLASETPAPDEEEEAVMVAYARPRRIGGHEVWTLWPEEVEDPKSKFSFARLELSTARQLRLGFLGGNEGNMTGTLDLVVADELARLLADPKTVVEFAIECAR